jgi:hypothetical protein
LVGDERVQERYAWVCPWMWLFNKQHVFSEQPVMKKINQKVNFFVKRLFKSYIGHIERLNNSMGVKMKKKGSL